MPSLPTGTVTFLFIDIEGFTTLLRQKRSKAITAFREFPGRPQFPGAPGWDEVADYALSWALESATGKGLAELADRLEPQGQHMTSVGAPARR